MFMPSCMHLSVCPLAGFTQKVFKWILCNLVSLWIIVAGRTKSFWVDPTQSGDWQPFWIFWCTIFVLPNEAKYYSWYISSNKLSICWFMNLDIKQILADCWPWWRYVLYLGSSNVIWSNCFAQFGMVLLTNNETLLEVFCVTVSV